MKGKQQTKGEAKRGERGSAVAAEEPRAAAALYPDKRAFNNALLAYEARYEDFGVTASDGRGKHVRFEKAGFLASGDQPEIFLFQVDGQAVRVGIAGEALRRFQQMNRHLTREEKIDLAGIYLKQAIEHGGEAAPANLFIETAELERLIGELRLMG